MEQESVNIIRESTRNLLKINRQMHKNEACDSRRSIREMRITSENISEIANKLKSKSTISVNELKVLKNSFMDDIKNIDVFLSVHGAMRGLIRELTGSNVKKQCTAAGCCCNLALGDLRSCSTVAKAAGPYLVAALGNLSVELAVTCTWALGNLAGVGPKTCNILVAQGALCKLSDIHINEDLQEAATYALIHFAYQMKDDLRPEHLQKIIQTITELELNRASANLLFILSCHENFTDNITEKLSHKLLQEVHPAVQAHTTCGQIHGCCKLMYILRTLANMDTMYDVIFNYFVLNNTFEVFRQLINLNSVTVMDSIFWLWGNLNSFSGG